MGRRRVDHGQRHWRLGRAAAACRPLCEFGSASDLCFYTQVGNRLLFASEVKALFAHPDAASIRTGSHQVFTYWSHLCRGPCSKTSENANRAITWCGRDGRLSTEDYWQLQFELDTSDKSERQWAEELIELLFDSTRLRSDATA